MKTADNFKIKMNFCLFTVDKGIIKVLLYKKTGEPYKGYWGIMSKTLDHGETFEENTKNILKTSVGLEEVYTETYNAFEDKETELNDKVVHVATIGLIDIATATFKREAVENKETEWFDIFNLPKLSYNHEEIITTIRIYLKRKLRDTDMIRLLFPSDFTLPEIQTFCQQIQGKSFDRRNFRKKILLLNILEDTGDKSNTKAGRPAKLYKFKENIEFINLF